MENHNLKVSNIVLGHPGGEFYITSLVVASDTVLSVKNAFSSDVAVLSNLGMDFYLLHSKSPSRFLRGDITSSVYEGQLVDFDNSEAFVTSFYDGFFPGLSEEHILIGQTPSVPNAPVLFSSDYGNTVVSGSSDISSFSVQSGLIAMWSGSIASIPDGWYLCDGANGTPDLRDRFVIGAGASYGLGQTGGEPTHTLSVTELPSHTHAVSPSISYNTQSHTHTITLGSASSHGHIHSSTVSGYNVSMTSATRYSAPSGTSYRVVNGISNVTTTRQSSSVNHGHDQSSSIGYSGSHSHKGAPTLSSVGSTGSHENRPPYYSLAFIMKA